MADGCRPECDSHPMEMRASPRVAISLSASVALASMGDLPARLRDIGAGGACVQTRSPWALSWLRRITIDLGNGECVTFRARGCWQRDCQMENAILTGLHFVDLSASDTRRLEKLVHKTAEELRCFVADSPDLGHLSFDDAFCVSIFSRLREARAGTYVCQEGSKSFADQSLFLIREGEVDLEAAGWHAHQVQFERIGPGRAFGGVPLVADVPVPVSAHVARDVVLLELDREAFRYLERANPLLAERLRRTIIRKNVEYLRSAIERLNRPPAG